MREGVAAGGGGRGGWEARGGEGSCFCRGALLCVCTECVLTCRRSRLAAADPGNAGMGADVAGAAAGVVGQLAVLGVVGELCMCFTCLPNGMPGMRADRPVGPRIGITMPSPATPPGAPPATPPLCLPLRLPPPLPPPCCPPAHRSLRRVRLQQLPQPGQTHGAAHAAAAAVRRRRRPDGWRRRHGGSGSGAGCGQCRAWVGRAAGGAGRGGGTRGGGGVGARVQPAVPRVGVPGWSGLQV